MISGPFTLAQLSRVAGIGAQEIRLYQQRGLLQRPRRRRGRSGDLAYHREHVERLRFIQRALGLGYSLDDIAGLIDPDALVTCRDVYDATVRCVQQLQAQEPQRAATLAHLVETCPRVGGRTDCPILSSLRLDQAS